MEVLGSSDNRAVVSGGGSGIGRAIACRLLAEGVPTAVADLRFPDDLPQGLLQVTCDVGNGPAVDALFARVHDTIGAPTILVCCAGQGIHETLTEGDPEKWRRVIDTNLLGALRLVRAFVPGMLAGGRGDVVLLSSVSARRAYPYGGVYAATKAALEVVAETLRLEVLPTVRVTTVAPGVTDTPFFEHSISGSHTVEGIGVGSISPEDVARAVLFALTQPEGVSLNEITLRPTAQPL